jgi:putative transposase
MSAGRWGSAKRLNYVWKKRCADLDILEVCELRQLRDENARLKRLVADLTLDRHVLQEVIKGCAAMSQRSLFDLRPSR